MALAGIREASRLIFVDELTGLYNRRFMRQYLRDRLAQLAQDGTPLAVIMLDLDGLKEINDTYGHLDGDRILKMLAELIRDAIPQGGYAIRFAGDEFLVFLEGVDGEGALRVAEQLRERVSREPFVTAKAPAGIPVRASLGVAVYPADAPSASKLLEAADEALYRSKRAGKNRVTRAGASRVPPEVEVFRRFPCPRLVGREAELAEIERLLTDAGHNRVLLVEASPGLGKSRLLLEVMRRAGSMGHHCFLGRCLESERTIPYSTLRPVLAACLARVPEQREMLRSRLGASSLAELAVLLPELEPPDGPREARSQEERRSLLFHGVADLLCLLSADAPQVLLLDDLHFMDEASLEVLYCLLDHTEGHVTVYGAVQSEALERHEDTPLPFARLLGLLLQSPNLYRVSLSPLTGEQVGQMVTEILQRHTPSPDFLHRLHEASQGIPLFVEETLKALINGGTLRAVDGIWDLAAVESAVMPTSLEGAVRGRLDALDRELHEVVAKAAVVGSHMDLALLASVLGKDPGETQHLVEMGKKQRVFEEPGIMAGEEEEVRFLSQCFQQLVYDGIDPTDRRRTHRTVGEVTERLAGGQVEQVLGPLAHHFERSDDPVKGEIYRQRAQELSGQIFSAAEIEREMSLDVGSDREGPRLDAETWPLAERLLRGVAVAVKNMRVYPSGSQLVQNGVSAVDAVLLELLKRVDALTLGEEEQGLYINGQPVEQKGLLPVTQDLLRIFADHGIRRCTFERGIADADVLGLLKILSGPGHGTQQEVGVWARRLRSEGIGHVRIFPAIYLASGVGTAAWRREHAETLMDDPTLLLARDVLRSLVAVVDNIRLYPPESQLITLTLEQLERHAQAMLARVPSLTVAMAERTIVVNATRPNPRVFGITIEILQKLMDDSGLTSLTIHRGVTREEMRTFLTDLAQSLEAAPRDPSFFQRLLAESGIGTIEVGTRAYTAADRLATGESPGAEALGVGGPPEREAVQVSEAELTLEQASRLLEKPLAAFLDPGVQEQIPPVLLALSGMGRENLAERLVERTAAALTETDGALRAGAAAGLGFTLGRVGEEPTALVLDKIVGPLAEAMAREENLQAFRAETELATAVLGRLLRTGDLQGAARLTSALGSAIPKAPDLPRFTDAVRGVVDAVASTENFELVLGLKGADPARRDQAKAVLAGFGPGAGAYLVELLHDTADGEIARVAAELLAALGEAGVRLVTRGLEQEESVARLKRVVSLLDVLAPALGADFLFLVGHPEAGVRQEMVRTLTRVPRENALRFVSQALSHQRSRVLLGALESACRLEAVELLDTVIRLVKTPPDQNVLRAACLSLGRLGDARAVIVLLGIVDRRPRFFGLVKGAPEAARVAAVRSLGEFGTPAARAGLKRARRDPAKGVRLAAQRALLRLRRESRSKESG